MHFLLGGSLFCSHPTSFVFKKALVEFHTGSASQKTELFKEEESVRSCFSQLLKFWGGPSCVALKQVMASRPGFCLCLPLLCGALRVQALVGPGPAPSPGEVAPVRIGTWLSAESAHLSEREDARVRGAAELAASTVASFLSVRPVLSPLLLERDVSKYCRFLWKNSSSVNYNRCGQAKKNYKHETCLDMKIPDEHLAGCKVHPQANSTRAVVLRRPGAGVADVDFLLYLHVQASDKCRAQVPGLLAYAAHCRTDAGGRPLAGVVVLCRDRLTKLTAQTVLHELLHALGFSKDLFDTWRDCSSENDFSAGVTCSPRGKVTHVDGWGQMRLYTPSVISALRRHLVAAGPELGAPLENWDAAPGMASSHWESRLLQGSVMLATPSRSGIARIDPLTLAAFRDTGWYVVNASRAQDLVWGKGEGALFGSTSTCHDNSSSFFCSGSGLGCHHLHGHKARCQSDHYLDGCRIYKPLEKGSECWEKANERNSNEERQGGEIFGPDSRCFFSHLSTLNHSQLMVTGRCYRHKCSGLNRYQVQVLGSDWVDCPAGGSIQIRGYRGSVFCPNERLCLDWDVRPPSKAEDGVPTGQRSP
ncbi:ciliated left-right organizer metallopeptidase isoform 3-T3 [Syngnathus typhle]